MGDENTSMMYLNYCGENALCHIKAKGWKPVPRGKGSIKRLSLILNTSKSLKEREERLSLWYAEAEAKGG